MAFFGKIKRYILRINPYFLLSFIFVGFFYGWFLAHKIDLATSDIGRHLMNGKVLLEEGKIVGTNFYSFTNPDFPVVTHHWFSGAIFYLAYLVGNFSGMHFAYVIFGIATFGIFFILSKKRGELVSASVAALFFLPLLAQRVEVRPEMFSYFFAGVFLLLLFQYKNGERTFRSLALWLSAIEIFWVNTHIYFFLGPIFVGIFLFDAILRRQKDTVKHLTLLLAIISAATLLNPFGWRGMIEPFLILQHYGYMLVENQPIWFFHQRFGGTAAVFTFEILMALFTLSFAFRARYKTDSKNIIIDFLVAFLAIGMGVFQMRNFAISGLLMMPILTANISPLWKSVRVLMDEDNAKFVATFFLSCLAFLVFIFYPSYFAPKGNFGLGLAEGNDGAASFVEKEEIKGPIFNNYDIGSYLIFYLYPREKVFVDNRPEAYPDEFFKEEYIPMQENVEVWNRQMEKYKFNSVIFSHRDMTPWGQDFLVRLIDDPLWAPVFVDQYAIIFLRRAPQNADIISRRELPRSAFSVSKVFP